MRTVRPWGNDSRSTQTIFRMKKKRRAKGKLALEAVEWQEENYSPPMVPRALPHTGETKIIRAPLPKSVAPRPQQHRPAA